MTDLDRLTLNELYALHAQLGQQGEQLHQRYMALPTTISDEANILMASCAEISGTMGDVYAVIVERNAEIGVIMTPRGEV